MNAQEIMGDQTVFLRRHYNSDTPDQYTVGGIHPDASARKTEIDVYDDAGEFYDSFDVPFIVSMLDDSSIELIANDVIDGRAFGRSGEADARASFYRKFHHAPSKEEMSTIMAKADAMEAMPGTREWMAEIAIVAAHERRDLAAAMDDA